MDVVTAVSVRISDCEFWVLFDLISTVGFPPDFDSSFHGHLDLTIARASRFSNAMHKVTEGWRVAVV
jgi:hypothetical protein